MTSLLPILRQARRNGRSQGTLKLALSVPVFIQDKWKLHWIRRSFKKAFREGSSQP